MMDRPKREDYMIIENNYTLDGVPVGLAHFDNQAYQEALNNYVDQLEKALDKACEWLADYDDDVYGLHITKEQWKERIMKDEENHRE